MVWKEIVGEFCFSSRHHVGDEEDELDVDISSKGERGCLEFS